MIGMYYDRKGQPNLTVRQLIDRLSALPGEIVVSASYDCDCARGAVVAVEAGHGDGAFDAKCDAAVLVID